MSLYRYVGLLVALTFIIAGNSDPALCGESVKFSSARPVWPMGKSLEKNCFVCFRALCDRPDGDAVSV